MTRCSVPQVIATLFIVLCLTAVPAFADETVSNPVSTYARVLRVMNPHLPDWQRRKYAASVLANAHRTHVDPRFIMAIVTVESSWRANAVSRSGARGLGQLMPSTAATLDVNARDASENLRGTSSYLKSLLDRFRGQQHWFEKAIAGYNAGPNAVKRFGGIPPNAQTQRYVIKVLRVYEQLYGRVAIAWTPYVSHHLDQARRAAGADHGDSADSALALSPILAVDDFILAPIPDFKSSFY
jgi:soluble lytic murein transglycosylase-like protein